MDNEQQKITATIKAPTGDACCGPTETPEQVVKSLVPRLNETIFEILSEEPFKGESAIVTGSGEPMFIKPEYLITTITAFTLKLLNEKIIQRRKIAFTGEVAGVSALESIRVEDLLTINVSIEKLPFMKVPESKHKVFIALVNQTTNQVMIDEIEPSLAKDTRKFMVRMRQPGKNKFKAYVFGGDGQIEGSFSTEFNVQEKK